MFKCNYKISKRLIFCLFLYFLGFYLLNRLSGLFTAGYPVNFPSQLSAANTIQEKIHLLLRNTLRNTLAFFNPASDDIVQFIQRMFYFAILLLLIFLSFFKRENGRFVFSFSWDVFCIAIVLGTILFMTVLLYDIFNWRDYRTLSPMLFGILIWIIIHYESNSELAKKALFLPSACVILSLLVLPKHIDYQFISPRPLSLQLLDGPGYVELTNNRNSDYIVAVSADLLNDINLFASISPEYGVMSFYDMESIIENQPPYVISEQFSNPSYYYCGNIGNAEVHKCIANHH